MKLDFKGLYDFHGHRCPMSTMGARMGLAAMAALDVTKADQFQVEGRCFAKNCSLDGVQYTTGCTLGNGNLTYEDEGRTAFELRRRDGRGGVLVSASDEAVKKFLGFKELKASLLEEREISGLPRAREIDAEISRGFESLVDWVQSAKDSDLLTTTGIRMEGGAR